MEECSEGWASLKNEIVTITKWGQLQRKAVGLSPAPQLTQEQAYTFSPMLVATHGHDSSTENHCVPRGLPGRVTKQGHTVNSLWQVDVPLLYRAG